MYPVPQTAIFALWLRRFVWRFKSPAPNHRRIRSLMGRSTKSRQDVTNFPFIDTKLLRCLFGFHLQVEETDQHLVQFRIVKGNLVRGLVTLPEVWRGWFTNYFG